MRLSWVMVFCICRFGFDNNSANMCIAWGINLFHDSELPWPCATSFLTSKKRSPASTLGLTDFHSLAFLNSSRYVFQNFFIAYWTICHCLTGLSIWPVDTTPSRSSIRKLLRVRTLILVKGLPLNSKALAATKFRGLSRLKCE